MPSEIFKVWTLLGESEYMIEYTFLGAMELKYLITRGSSKNIESSSKESVYTEKIDDRLGKEEEEVEEEDEEAGKGEAE